MASGATYACQRRRKSPHTAWRRLDMVFADGYAGQLATTSGDPGGAIAVSLNVGV